jgi:cold shock CspA family protein
MRTHGTLTSWNDDRGFGFISPAQGGENLFVHISAFPRGSRPRVDETISFETEMGPKGTLQAIRVMRPGSASRARPQTRTKLREPGGT